MTRIMGLDVSSTAAGIAVVEDEQLRFHEQWTYGVADAKDDAERARSLVTLMERVRRTVIHHRPEKIYLEQLYITLNMTTVRNISYAEGAAMMGVVQTNVPFEKLNVASYRKRVFGKNLSKEEAAQAIRERFGKTEMHLPTPRSRIEVPVFTDDEADATACALYHWAA